MKCVSYNIQYGLGADGRYDLARIAGEVAEADVIALQEVDRHWARSGMVDSPAALAEALPGHHWVYGANLDMDAGYEAEGRVVHRRKQFGTMILSRWPILSSRNFPLPKWGDRQHHSIQQGLLEAVIGTPLGPVRVYSVHLSHLSPFTRLPQIDRIRDILDTAPFEGGAWCGGHPDPAAGWTEEAPPPMPASWILMGDMNFRPGSEEYTRLVGGEAKAFGRLTNRMGPLDAWVLAGHDEAAGSTHPNAGARIDHCFVSSDLADRVRDAHIDDTATGSDHWPVWVEFG
ncbi:endonuclease/exonuclease/phosphatase family protein [Psychromarinibacter sp. C21-152]|uniref:Endonuclease/exonuclease/phosphatase family protein n=1 Tax=Psychromarinibacter sediminicola TaxID=3033385 RepID=A0AAE3NVY0_9RHOB|nr:endonuclease/exonuclease/phosphatase family protein [Psychromarinibacter sediminicola]MDF0603101.1 endonuclease/exonuclease/phosphatase family protein [Psychromarinibacter sediminicola]